jgi:hypothetical protein
VKLSGSDVLLVGICYRSTSSDTENNDRLLQVIDRIPQIHGVTHTLIFGDFNYGEIDWVNHQVQTGENADPQKFFDKVQDTFLHQSVTFPTRYRSSNKPSTRLSIYQ